MRLRRLAVLIVIAGTVAGCSALNPNPVTETVTAVATTTATSISTAVSTALSTTWATVTSTVTELLPTTTTATPIMDIAGPQNGRACAADSNYSDEKPRGLDKDAAQAWRQAVSAAAEDGVTLCLNDGKRSRTQQQEIYDDYLRQYGQATADELVLPPDKSSHVTGFAIDVQPAAAYAWLEATDGSLGFCRTYDNEPWHFEYRAEYMTGGCPDRLPEPVR